MALNGLDATAARLLLAKTAAADIADAHVVICAQRAGQAEDIQFNSIDLSGRPPESL